MSDMPRSENWLGRDDITHGVRSHEHEMGRKFYQELASKGFTDPKNPNSELARQLWHKRHNILLLYGGNNPNEAQYLLEHAPNIPEVAKAVTEAIENKGYTTVIIDRATETLHPQFVKNMDDFGTYMAEHHPDIEVIVISSSYNAPQASKWCKNVKLVGIAGFMYIGAAPHPDFFDPTITKYDTHVRKKAMLNLNRLAKPARLFAMALMSERDILKHSLTSMTFYCDIAKNWKTHFDSKTQTYQIANSWPYVYPDELSYDSDMLPYDSITLRKMGMALEKKVQKHIVNKGLHHKNWVIDNDDVGGTNPAYLCPHENHIFQDTWFSFVNETHTKMPFGHTELRDDVFFSEKTSKALIHKHPFILFSSNGAIRELHNMGFKTFEPIIDESYDLIENPQERLEACIDQAEKLCKYSHEDWLEAHKILHPIVEHNNRMITNKTFKLFNLDRPWNIV